jgi:hypothetical protein
MGTLRGDNGGERPPDGGGLPDFPPEWGTIVIPDDAAELDGEASALRKELRRTARRDRWRLRLGLTRRPGSDTPALGLPLLIMSVAIIATLTSLFALAWPGRTITRPLTGTAGTTATAAPVPDLTLFAADHSPVKLRENLPAVVLLVDGCACGDLVAAAANAAPARVTVLAVARSVPDLTIAVPPGKKVRALADDTGTLRATYAGSPPKTGVVAVLVRGDGRVARAIPEVTKVDDFRAELIALT